MSVIQSYHRISLEKFCEIERDCEKAESYFRIIDSSGNHVGGRAYDLSATSLCIDRQWEALHYLLSGERNIDDHLFWRDKIRPPLSKIASGGQEMIWETDCNVGALCFFTADEIQEISQALNNLPQKVLRTRFEARGNLKLYSQKEHWDEESWHSLLHVFSYVSKFFNQAAEHNQLVLSWSG